MSAIEGRYGDFHRNARTFGSDLFINPLMSLYWCFRLENVAKRILYLDGIREIHGYNSLSTYIQQFHNSATKRQHRDLPV